MTHDWRGNDLLPKNQGYDLSRFRGIRMEHD